MSDNWTFEGTFETSGDRASGTWKAVIGSQTLTGTWIAQPKT
jgi:hypothetical protein